MHLRQSAGAGLGQGRKVEHFVIFQPTVFFNKILFHQNDTITYPPPKVKALRVKVALNSSQKSFRPFFFMALLPFDLITKTDYIPSAVSNQQIRPPFFDAVILR